MAGKVSGRIKRAITSSLILFAVAGVLAVSNVVMQGRERNIALASQSEAQKQFFVAGVDRPDISVFYKRFSSAEKVEIAQNLRRYDDPKLVKLAVTWLTDFDVEARKELQATLVEAAPKQPKALAEQLTAGGGFQKLVVAAALKSSFDATLPNVIQQLSVAGARANAVEYLVAQGTHGASELLTQLDSEDKDVRLAAADALGKIGFEPAGKSVLELYEKSEGADKASYLAALANMGSYESITLFTQLLNRPGTSPADRASAILGLGRIGSSRSVVALWYEMKKEPLDKKQIIEALSLIGDPAFNYATTKEEYLLEVAGGVKSEKADRIVVNALKSPKTALRAAELSEKRPGVATALSSLLRNLDPKKQGSMIEVVVRSLASSSEGRKLLEGPEVQAKFAGFIEREQSRAR